MTTPGGQLSTGDDQNPPVYGVPDGAYVGDAGSPNAITDLNNLTESEAKNRMKSQIAPSFVGQRDGVWGFFSTILGAVQGAVGLVVGTVQAVVDGIAAVINSIGSLFSAGHHDIVVSDQARVDGENAIVANMSESLEFLDEIQRVGGGYSSYLEWSINDGERYPHPLPLNGGFPLYQGTSWIPPVEPLTHTSSGYNFSDSDTSRGRLALGGGTLRLMEDGLWMIYFQAGLLQGPAYTETPADLWCYVSNSEFRVPVGPLPASGVFDAYFRHGGPKTSIQSSNVIAYGRAGQYLGVRDSFQGGGNTVSGYFMCYLDSPDWYVHLSCTGFRHFGGAASTFVFAQKVNSESIRDNIDDLKGQIAASLPGENVDMLLTETNIQAMVSEAANLEVPEVVVPTDPPEPGNG